MRLLLLVQRRGAVPFARRTAFRCQVTHSAHGTGNCTCSNIRSWTVIQAVNTHGLTMRGSLLTSARQKARDTLCTAWALM